METAKNKKTKAVALRQTEQDRDEGYRRGGGESDGERKMRAYSRWRRGGGELRQRARGELLFVFVFDPTKIWI